MANSYDAGDKARLSIVFTDSTGAAFDPPDVSLKYALPNAAATTQDYNPGNIVRDGVGLYHYDLDTTGMSGVLTYEWIVAPGAGQSASVSTLYIRALPI